MVSVKNKDAPATKRQLWRISQLTGNDATGWQINRQKASDIIEALELDLYAENQEELFIPEGVDPLEEAKVTIVVGDQRQGKTCTGVARLVDAYKRDCAKVFLKETFGVDCKVTTYNMQERLCKFEYNNKKHEIIVPKEAQLHSPMRIYSNLHLFGLPYAYIPSFQHLLKWLKNGTISFGYLFVDEAHIGMNARSSMSKLGKEIENQSFQYGKAMLNVIIATHNPRMIDWTIRTIPTEWLSCTFDKTTWRVTYTRKKKGIAGTQEFSYYAPQYYPYYWTNERINQ